jgi:hypothetical protein
MDRTLRTWTLLCACLALLGAPAGCGSTSGGDGGGTTTPPAEASLAALAVSTGALVPTFDPGTLVYGVGPGFLDGEVTITATAADGGTLEVNGVPTPSGTPSVPIPLPFGVTPVTVVVTSSDGAVTETYTVVLDRQGLSAQEAYVKASNTDGSDYFGYAVAISGDTLVVGAPIESSSATGVNPGPAAEADDGAQQSGAVYVFVRSGTTWTQQAYLKASNADVLDTFGAAVAIDLDTVVVGAMGEDSLATGVNPGPAAEADDGAEEAGAVYVFVRSGTTWTQQAYVKASNTDSMDRFGSSVAIQGDTMVVGAVFEDSAATGANPGAAAEDDDGAENAGAAYVFVRSGGVWAQQAYLKASNTGAGDGFGASVALSGDTLVAGAHGEDGNGTGPNPGPAAEADDSSDGAGAAYVFVRSGTTWAQQAYLKASNTGAGDFFGVAVAASGDTIVVGAPGERSGFSGVEPGPAAEADDSLPSSGAAYVFVRSGTTWSQDAYVKASNPGTSNQFGYAVALEGELIVVGSPYEPSGATGVNPGPAAEADTSAGVAGAVYVYAREAGAWTKHAYVKASNTDSEDRFGFSVRTSGGTIAAGAFGESSAATGVNPGPAAEADDSATAAGAVYVVR